MGKRLLDITVAALGLLLLSPVLLLIALAVRLESPGPALFRQRRVGLHGKEFEILKFRSMRAAAGSGGPLITVTGDRRITRVGALIRATKADELPQLWNVLRGDMSLVGPRPEVPRYVALYSAEQRRVVLSVRPGITDEASIAFADESSLLAAAADPESCYTTEILPRKLALYEKYVASRSTVGDIGIILRTLLRVLRRK